MTAVTNFGRKKEKRKKENLSQFSICCMSCLTHEPDKNITESNSTWEHRCHCPNRYLMGRQTGIQINCMCVHTIYEKDETS